jgi:Conjugal transfer protein TraD
MTHRVEASQRRTDTREWVMQRRERTRHLIELGGLVQKAGLIELTDDDRAILLGAFLAVAAKLQGDDREQAITLWRRGGQRAFADSAASN